MNVPLRLAAATVAQEAEHLTLKFDADALDVALPQIPAQGLMAGVRVLDPASLAVDLGPRFGAFRATASRSTPRRARRSTSSRRRSRRRRRPPAAPGLTGAASVRRRRSAQAVLDHIGIRTIVIDAGHGGDDAGVVGPGGRRKRT